jgi:thiol-disulfide isomerase/thioredoxin
MVPAAAVLADAPPQSAPGARKEAPYPPGSDMVVLSKDGSKVGPLARLRVAGKYTIFDVYADWCEPCRAIDARLREIARDRHDVAIRKLNVVDYDSPLALELGDSVSGLPHLEIYTPKGRHIVIEGTDYEALDKALALPPSARQ